MLSNVLTAAASNPIGTSKHRAMHCNLLVYCAWLVGLPAVFITDAV